MTLFSYLVSETKNENFREPELLAKLLHRIIPELKKEYSHLAGWNLHYAVGIVFTIIYSILWKKTKLKPGLKTGFVFGGISGILAVIVWKLTFAIHPNPPKTSYKKYYRHLFVTHLVFGIFTAIGYSLLRKRTIIR
jgi:hypothetical protein